MLNVLLLVIFYLKIKPTLFIVGSLVININMIHAYYIMAKHLRLAHLHTKTISTRPILYFLALVNVSKNIA